MTLALFGAALLLAAPETYTLRHRFEKRMVCEETTERELLYVQMKWDASSVETLRRTVEETDGSDHPTVERVEVLKFARTERIEGRADPLTVIDPAQGRTFVWRRLKERWGLFDASGEVSDGYAKLVEQLKSWRDARMPKEPVAVGGTWEVSVAAFLEASGQPVPEGTTGLARFSLDEVKGDVATISFRFVAEMRLEGKLTTSELKGTLRFDVKRGRDLGYESEGTVRVEGVEGEPGTFRLRRSVAYRDSR
ncbi:MAG: hypothetical protein ACREID_08850 [Planctomycetota bacterium]